jgi:hypothetical protein
MGLEGVEVAVDLTEGSDVFRAARFVVFVDGEVVCFCSADEVGKGRWCEVGCGGFGGSGLCC